MIGLLFVVLIYGAHGEETNDIYVHEVRNVEEDVLSVPVSFPRNTQSYEAECSLPPYQDSLVSKRENVPEAEYNINNDG